MRCAMHARLDSLQTMSLQVEEPSVSAAPPAAAQAQELKRPADDAGEGQPPGKRARSAAVDELPAVEVRGSQQVLHLHQPFQACKTFRGNNNLQRCHLDKACSSGGAVHASFPLMRTRHLQHCGCHRIAALIRSLLEYRPFGSSSEGWHAAAAAGSCARSHGGASCEHTGRRGGRAR